MSRYAVVYQTAKLRPDYATEAEAFREQDRLTIAWLNPDDLGVIAVGTLDSVMELGPRVSLCDVCKNAPEADGLRVMQVPQEECEVCGDDDARITHGTHPW